MSNFGLIPYKILLKMPFVLHLSYYFMAKPGENGESVVSLNGLRPQDRATFLELEASGAFESNAQKVTFIRELTAEAAAAALAAAGGTDWRSAARVARR